MRTRTMRKHLHGVRVGVLATALAFIVSMLAVAPASAHGGAVKPTGLLVSASSTAGAMPPAVVAPGASFTLKVTLTPANAKFSKSTTLKLKTKLASGAAPSGSLSAYSVVMPAGVNSKTFTVSYSGADTGVIVTASTATSMYPAVAPGSTQPFDVYKAPTAFRVTTSTALTAPGEPFDIEVSLEPAGAMFVQPTALTLTPSLVSGAPPNGTLEPSSVVMPAGVTSKTFTISYSAPDSGLTVTASTADVPPVAPGTSDPIDVVIRPTGLGVVASTDNSGIEGAVPDVLVQVDQPFNLDVTLRPEGAEFTQPTTLTLTPTLTSGAAPSGTLDPVTVVMPAGATSQRFQVSYSAADNGVVVTAAVQGTSTVAPGSSAPFDVQKELETFDANDPRLETGLGVGNADCTAATTEPLCGTVVLANGIASPQGALSLGECTADLGCRNGSQVVQFVADLGNRYSRRDPALLIIRCDAALCPGKKVGPIYDAVYDALKYKVALSFEATGPLSLTSQPCLLPGIARDLRGNDYCTDLYQSHRDTNGDLLLYLLFTHDMRGSTR